MDFQSIKRRDTNEEWNPRHLSRQQRTQSFADTVQPTRPDGIVSQLYSSILPFFQDVLVSFENSEEARRMEPMSTSLYRQLDSVYTSFITWGNDWEVGTGNLDEILKYSRGLQLLTIKIMIRICETIANGGSSSSLVSLCPW